MLTWYMIIFAFVTLLGVSTLYYQVFRMIQLDAACRGFKHPTFWAVFFSGGNNGGSGMLLYLLGRKKYPSVMTEEQRSIMVSRKKRAGVSLCFLAAGTIFLAVSCILNGF